MKQVPATRIRKLNEAKSNRDGDYVLYWMVASRRGHWNYALDRAIELAMEFDKPVIVLEALRCDYQWACDRFHHFVVQGMRVNLRRFSDTNVVYYPYVEPSKGQGSGLLKALAQNALAVVSDDYPCFFIPAQHRAAVRQVDCAFEVVDSNGLLPMHVPKKTFARAFDFRRYLQKHLPRYLDQRPRDSLAGVKVPRAAVPERIQLEWPAADVESMAESTEYLADLPIDHSVGVVSEMEGGEQSALKQLRQFIESRMKHYADDRNQPDSEAASGLSSWLHFGHLSVHEVFAEICEATNWTPDEISDSTRGASRGWWGMDENAEAFLDELITWRELGFNMCSHERHYDRYQSLPSWARQSLAKHAKDRREHQYTMEELENAETHDQLWNAAQWQLVSTGRMHNYLRMLWGKKILEWSPSPEHALETLIELNNKYAIDGRDPNSYSGIFWVLGRYDRAWGPERPIFGKVRYMSSKNTARKLRLGDYIERYSPPIQDA